MSFQKTPGGTRGSRGAGASNPLSRFMMRMMTSWHRRSGDKFMGMDLLYLTTVGAKSGQKRQSTVSRFADGDDAWLVVASAGGSATNPGWYHNIAAHPDQVRIEFGGQQIPVTVEQLQGDARTAGVAANHRGPASLRRRRAEDRPGHPDPAAHPRDLTTVNGLVTKASTRISQPHQISGSHASSA